jgi:hypothetical protein
MDVGARAATVAALGDAGVIAPLAKPNNLYVRMPPMLGFVPRLKRLLLAAQPTTNSYTVSIVDTKASSNYPPKISELADFVLSLIAIISKHFCYLFLASSLQKYAF